MSEPPSRRDCINVLGFKLSEDGIQAEVEVADGGVPMNEFLE
jgi:hypothetical protein